MLKRWMRMKRVKKVEENVRTWLFRNHSTASHSSCCSTRIFSKCIHVSCLHFMQNVGNVLANVDCTSIRRTREESTNFDFVLLPINLLAQSMTHIRRIGVLFANYCLFEYRTSTGSSTSIVDSVIELKSWFPLPKYVLFSFFFLSHHCRNVSPSMHSDFNRRKLLAVPGTDICHSVHHRRAALVATESSGTNRR